MAIKGEGIARMFDTISATSIIAAAASIAGYGNINPKDVVLLCLITPFLIGLSWQIRRT